ncbi:hypothetical protein [Salmonella phage GSW6]|uniref:Uncharacterized protein n=1 Tax=Salmonella phage GSW6 TaxID=3025422 RepID=A0AAE9YN37_9CAUD|nr:hypothetical protein [Salmonella phage GSW6]
MSNQLQEALEFIQSNLSKDELIEFAKSHGMRNSELMVLLDKRSELREEYRDVQLRYTTQLTSLTEQIEGMCEHQFTETFLYNDDDGWSNLRPITSTYERV